MRHQLHTEIEIDASPEIVWNILTQLELYSDWNPFIVSAEGDVAVGERLTNRIVPPGGKAMTFKPTITAADDNERLEWLGRLGFPGIFDGRHRFELHATSNGGTHLVHTEHIRGLLVRLVRSSLDTGTLRGFEAMNAALKSRAEAFAGNVA